jgi:4-amino-4-deoxy-L-arabinose transferase-like glycosyltransferase
MLPALFPRVSVLLVACAKRQTEYWPLIGVQFCATCLLFLQLGNHDLWASHEARAAQDAQYFLDTHHWGLLRLVDGTPEYQKPPLFYWLVAGVAALRGGQVDDVAVRLPAAVAGWLTVAAIMAFLLNRGRPRAAWIAGLALTTTHHFVSISRTGRIDVPLTCALTLAILFAMDSRPWASGLCLAAALMLKGPVGVVMAIAVVLAGSARFFDASRTMARAGIVCLLMGLPWFVAVGFETDWEFWREFFWHHNLQRAAGSASDLATHPIWFYPLRGMIDGLPWSLALPAVLWTIRKRWRGDAELRLGIRWLVVVTGLLSLSQFKRADYLLPAYPAAAIIFGCCAERVKLQYYHAIALGLTLAANIGYQFVVIPHEDVVHEKRSAAAIVRRHVEPGQQIIFFRVEDHLLAWRLDKPIATVREWENLDIWVSRLDPGYILMPSDETAGLPKQLHNGTLQEVERLEDRTDRQHPRTWVLMRSRPHAKCDGPQPETAASR